MCSDLDEFAFGKHSGKTVEEVADVDLLYLDWLDGQEWFEKHYLYRTVERTCNKKSSEIIIALEERDYEEFPDASEQDFRWSD